MKSAVIQALAVGWLLASLAGSLSGSPQRPYWTLPQVGVAVNYPEIGNRFSSQIDHGIQFQGSSSSPYESIDRFQLEQRTQLQNGPGQTRSWYDRETKYPNQFENDKKPYYQSLLRVTENPLRNFQNHEIAQEPQTYYPDYLNLDDNESFSRKQSNSERGRSKVNPSKASDALNKNAENPNEEKIATLMAKLIKDESYATTLNELEALNSLDDEMIAEATISEEIKRGVRQVRPQKPGFLWTLARLAFEKVNDTKSAVNQIGTIVNNGFPIEVPSTSRPISVTTTTTSSSVSDGDSTSSDTSANIISDDATTTTTTTEAPTTLTRKEIQGIIRRNVKGLIRLFNIEWRDALSQSQISVREFQRDLGNQVRPYLADKPINN